MYANKNFLSSPTRLGALRYRWFEMIIGISVQRGKGGKEVRCFQ